MACRSPNQGCIIKRFALLLHDWPTPHYDLLLEADGVLKTWRLAEPPRDGVRVEPIGDHRLLYLDYEGAVSGERGHVQRFDGGELTWHGDEFELHGETLQGRFAIRNDILFSFLTSGRERSASKLCLE